MTNPSMTEHPILSELASMKASMERLEAWLRDSPPTSKPYLKREVTCADVLSSVAFEWGIRSEAFLKHNQEAKFVEPRWSAWYLARKLTSFSYPQIARLMGEYDHSTVVTAVRKMATMRLSDVVLDGRLAAIEERLA